MGVLKCPECSATMQKMHGSKHELYYECIECGYGELMENGSENIYDYGFYDDELDKDYDDNLDY